MLLCLLLVLVLVLLLLRRLATTPYEWSDILGGVDGRSHPNAS
jgi:hypothetical protein